MTLEERFLAQVADWEAAQEAEQRAEQQAAESADRAEPEEPEDRETWTAVFKDAARRVRAEIRGAAALFPEDEEVVSLLGYLEAHLFDFTLDVKTWTSGSGCSRAARDRFVAELGPLKPYLDGHRIAVAAEVLRTTAAPGGKLGRRLGFKAPRTFQRTFERRIGMRPGDYQASAQPDKAGTEEADAEEAGTGTAPDGLDPEHGTRLLATYWRRQVILGLLDGERARELRRLLRRRYLVLRQGRRKGSWRSSWYEPSLLTGSDPELRADAFHLTAGAIERAAEQAPPELAELFHVLRQHLFKSKARLKTKIREAGFHEPTVRRRFADFTGQALWTYVREARLETAAMLLLLTSLTVVKISRLVGYANRALFHRQFRAFTGRGAEEYRQRARLVRKHGWMLCDDSDAAAYWEWAVSGQLSAEDALELDEYLEVQEQFDPLPAGS